ncbi:hypothetical protein GVO57_01390 [Sphingomonas changnyeongensis]|uniref:Uncharacterized protein n=1 Tax=Sphingomonas changnyeongensis TaxID=2698679 RepID=A0A7Z2NUP3_9SPHN|nr:hypothetical protein [Sphingomonas changnyeongensis]QHL89725.1 hypothetical protein GVO57_01390 [Sphingomonas changnyeongensis]
MPTDTPAGIDPVSASAGARAALRARAVFSCSDDRLFGRVGQDRLCLPAALAPVLGGDDGEVAVIALALAYHARHRPAPAPPPLVAAAGELLSSAVAEQVRARDDALPERVAERFRLPSPPAGRGESAPPLWVMDGLARARTAGVCAADLALTLRRIGDDARLPPGLRAEARATRRALGMFGWSAAAGAAC